MNKIGKFLTGFFLGALIGGGASILLAPYSGQRMRLEIRHYFESAAEEIRLASAQKRVELEMQLEELRAPQKASDQA